jgi:uncharacterized DUF497 family protein
MSGSRQAQGRHLQCTYKPVTLKEKHGPEIEFDWDHAYIGHLARHSVLPEEAEQVILNDPLDVRMEIVEGEERYLNVAATVQGRVLLVVTTRARRLSTGCNGVRTNQTAHSVSLSGTREVIYYGQEKATLQD